jgi:hypothetical protein
MKYMRLMARILLALAFTAVAFVTGVYLPLLVYWLFHGDPGMPGGAGLVIIGVPVGVIAALITGIFSLVRLHPWRELSR